MRYYQHHIGDFIKDTHYLSNEEVGIYLKLIWLYYDTEQPLPNDLGLLATKVNAKLQEDIVSSLLKLYFVLKDDCWIQFRCEQTIAEYHKQLESASKAGKASAAKRKSNANPTAVEQPLNACTTSVVPTNNHKPITNNHKPITTIQAPEGVSIEVWNDFVAQRKKARAVISENVISSISKEASKAGWTLEQALAECAARGWRGFKAEWVADKNTNNSDKLSNFMNQVNNFGSFSKLKVIGQGD